MASAPPPLLWPRLAPNLYGCRRHLDDLVTGSASFHNTSGGLRAGDPLSLAYGRLPHTKWWVTLSMTRTLGHAILNGPTPRAATTEWWVTLSITRGLGHAILNGPTPRAATTGGGLNLSMTNVWARTP